MGLLIRPRAKQSNEQEVEEWSVECGAWCVVLVAWWVRVRCVGASRVSMKKNVLSTSFRSETQATDSTCNGMQAKSAATKALRQNAPVRRLSSPNSNAVDDVKQQTGYVVAAGPARKAGSPACATATSADANCWHHKLVKAQANDRQLKPASTCGFS